MHCQWQRVMSKHTDSRVSESPANEADLFPTSPIRITWLSRSLEWVESSLKSNVYIWIVVVMKNLCKIHTKNSLWPSQAARFVWSKLPLTTFNGYLFQPVTCSYVQLSVSVTPLCLYYLFDSCITVSSHGCLVQLFCTCKLPLTAKAMLTDGQLNHLQEKLW